MTDEVRCLYRPGRDPAPGTAGAPLDPAAQQEIVEFLDASLMRPLFASDGERTAQVNGSLQTMSVPERVFIELEMRARQTEMYTSDYDPLSLNELDS